MQDKDRLFQIIDQLINNIELGSGAEPIG